MIRLSMVESVTDRRPETFGPLAWTEFVETLRAESAIPAEPSPTGKASTPCLSPAIYPPAALRSKAGVLGWEWFSADIDNKSGNRRGATIEEIAAKMSRLECPFVIYTTASHQPESHCFRLMFPIDRLIEPEEFEGAWRSFASEFACFDQQTKDISRLFIAPRAWIDRENSFLFSTSGHPVSVDGIIASNPIQIEVRRSPVPVCLARMIGLSGAQRESLDDLDRSLIVSQKAVEAALSSPPGGRMFRFLCSVACNARRQRVELDEHDLRLLADQMAVRLGRLNSADLQHDVRNALRFADRIDAGHRIDRPDRLDRLQAALSGRPIA